MQKIISCDWGTSSLRLRIVDIDKMSSLVETVSEQGIFATYNLWKESGTAESERLSFYQSILKREIKKLEAQAGLSSENIPLVISGMASSSIGMIDMAYTEIPFNAEVDSLQTKTIEATDDFGYKTLVVSGVKKDNDVMRGEETQLIGGMNNDMGDQLFIFPGTHSKHVSVQNGRVTDFTTFMTGEFFALLSGKSILSGSIEKSDDISATKNQESFEKGATDGSTINLLHSSFLVRTNDLFRKLSKEENYFYLSGLLIGTELKELREIKTAVTVVGDAAQTKLYSLALQKLGIQKIKYFDAGEAQVTGHCKMYKSRNQ
jgi:2-dehydro-3-deoxygalactonokinase